MFPFDGSPAFDPHPLLRHPHLMTIVPWFWPRRGLLKGVPTETRLFAVAPHSRLLASCHWQADSRRHLTLVLVHGLEGCIESHYMLGLAGKAWRKGINVIRLNQRNCGGTEHLTSTLYHSGLSEDIRAVVAELSARDRLEAIWLIGYSMGGNLVLKMAGETGAACSALRGVVAVCPNIDPGACVMALERPTNWIYQRHFLTRLKARLRRKAGLCPGRFNLAPLGDIRTLRAFDEIYTAPDGGYTSAEDYYDRAGARHVLAAIEVPTVILTAKDDPFIPHRMFEAGAIQANPRIRLWATTHGGHCGFIQRPRREEDRYWAENRLIELVVRASTA
jgi:predicted alpha/beta-fold hydrolase